MELFKNREPLEIIRGKYEAYNAQLAESTEKRSRPLRRKSLMPKQRSKLLLIRTTLQLSLLQRRS